MRILRRHIELLGYKRNFVIYSESDHLYAPFYVWQNATNARNFLIDDLFAGVVEAFSRHRVRRTEPSPTLVRARRLGR